MRNPPLEGIQACVFDAYGTLFAYASAVTRCRDGPGDKYERLNAPWGDKQLKYVRCSDDSVTRAAVLRAGSETSD
jgi:2-haloacid dehalogenase